MEAGIGSIHVINKCIFVGTVWWCTIWMFRMFLYIHITDGYVAEMLLLEKICLKLIEAERRIYASVNWAIIGSNNGLSPVRHQAIIWTNAGLFSIRHQGTYFNEISIEIQRFSFTKMQLNVSSAKWRPFCLGPCVLKCMCHMDITPLHGDFVAAV